MCGICGLVVRGAPNRDSLSVTLNRMVTQLAHRGPDGRGTQIFPLPELPGAVGLGHTRLSILDLSKAGLQPMASADHSLWISYNGEVYNFQVHREDLVRKGYRFASHTDTEVLVYLYQEYGVEFLKKLNGMFALALLDLPNKKLLLARDPIGVKPLYYHESAGRFIFASEIKGILASEMYSKDINWQAAYDYFTYLFVPCPATIFRDIWQVPPGHGLDFDLVSGSFKLFSYWDVRRQPEIETAPIEELQERANTLLTEAVKAQLISDVPLGIFLSGGIDSTTVAGLAREVSPHVKTFTAVFEGKDFEYFNEQAVARAVSRHLGTEHHEISVPATDLWPMLDLLDYFDQPFGNPTFYLMYLVSKYSRDDITVALCGAGGDELYAGYPRYKAVQLARRSDWIPALLWRLGEGALAPLHDRGKTALLRRARQFVSGMPLAPVERFIHWTYFMGNDDKRRLMTGAAGAWEPSERVVRQVLESSPLADPSNRLLHADVKTFLVDNVLEYTDKMSMAVSLESRVPLLDANFVEFSLNVPFRQKLEYGRSKILLRNVFARFLPPEAQNAPKKGFNAPLSRWVRNTLDGYFEASHQERHPLKETLGESIGTTWMEERVLDWSFIQRLRDQHLRGKADYSYELFSILMFDLWWRKHISAA